MKVLRNILFILFFIFPEAVFAVPTYYWTERQPAGAANKSWAAVSSDSDGSNLIAAVQGGRVYTSSDSGANWTERQPAGAVDKNWFAASSDADGSNLIVGSNLGRLYTSSNSGANWTERQPAGAADKGWYTVSSDSDGSNLIAGIFGGRLYTSSDSGANWTERQPAGAADKNWLSASSDSDGSNLIAGILASRLYTSSDSGANWTERQPAGDANKSWYVTSSDADGSNLIAGANLGRLYTSSNSGANWTERQPAGAVDKNWQTASSDSDGSNLIAAVSNGRLYASFDSGANWTEQQPAGAADKNWWAVSSDSDGSNLIAAVSGGRLYTAVLNTEPSFTAGPADSGAAVSVGINETFTATATDPEGDQYYLAICKTDAITPNASAVPTCTGGNWCISGATNSAAQATCAYTITGADVETNAWFAFVCDNNPNSQCSASSQGAGSTGSPFTVAAQGGGPSTAPPPSTGTGSNSITTDSGGNIGPVSDNGINLVTGFGSSISFSTILSGSSQFNPQTLVVSNASLNNNTADIIIFNSKSTEKISLSLNKTQLIDVDNDNVNDIEITLDNLTSNNWIELTIKQINQDIIAPNPESKPISLGLQIFNLQEKINGLLEQLENISNSKTQASQYSFSKNLKYQDVDEDVRSLQKYLNSNGFKIAETGPGSPNKETNIFGELTKKALIGFQEANLNSILKPSGLLKGTGYFGPSTRKFINFFWNDN